MSHQNFQYDIKPISSNVTTLYPLKTKNQRRKGIEEEHWLKIGYHFTKMKWLRWWRHQKSIRILPVCSGNNTFISSKSNLKGLASQSYDIIMFLQNKWPYIFWKIFKNWDSLNIWDLLNIYNSLNTAFRPAEHWKWGKLSQNFLF